MPSSSTTSKHWLPAKIKTEDDEYAGGFSKRIKLEDVDVEPEDLIKTEDGLALKSKIKDDPDSPVIETQEQGKRYLKE